MVGLAGPTAYQLVVLVIVKLGGLHVGASTDLVVAGSILAVENTPMAEARP